MNQISIELKSCLFSFFALAQALLNGAPTVWRYNAPLSLLVNTPVCLTKIQMIYLNSTLNRLALACCCDSDHRAQWTNCFQFHYNFHTNDPDGASVRGCLLTVANSQMLPRQPTGTLVRFLLMLPFDFQALRRQQTCAIQVFVEGAIVSLLATVTLSDICVVKHSITSCATVVVFPAL